MQFPKDFIWGAACASYQCEGAWAEDGKGPNIWDDFTHEPGHIDNNETGDTACDSYHRVDEDLKLIQSLGIKVYRFSISWARIFPEGTGAVNEKGFVYYDKLVDGLIDAGIEPWITLYHWDLPSALQREGGWLNRKTVDAFAVYAETVGRHFKGRVRCYMPINEPQCVCALGYQDGEHAPGWRLGREAVATVMHNLTVAHSLAARRLRELDKVTIGTATCGRFCAPEKPEYEDAAYRETFSLAEGGRWAFTHNLFLDSVFFGHYAEDAPDFLHRLADRYPKEDWAGMEKPDFAGLNIYNCELTGAQGEYLKRPTGWPRTAINWPITPEALYYGPKHIHRRYNIPVVITENGLSCNDKIYLDGKVHDADRIDFLTRYLGELHRAMEDGVAVKGYLHWSLLDNFEWAKGYSDRFGLIYVDYPTGTRTPKDSVAWYRRLTETGKLP